MTLRVLKIKSTTAVAWGTSNARHTPCIILNVVLIKGAAFLCVHQGTSSISRTLILNRKAMLNFIMAAITKDTTVPAYISICVVLLEKLLVNIWHRITISIVNVSFAFKCNTIESIFGSIWLYFARSALSYLVASQIREIIIKVSMPPITHKDDS